MNSSVLSGLSDASWFKSSYSDNGGSCVEVSPDFPGVVPVRDSKMSAGPALVVSEAAWTTFVDVAKGAGV